MIAIVSVSRSFCALSSSRTGIGRHKRQDAQNDGQWVIRIGRVIAPRLSAVRQGRFFGRFGFEV